MKAIEATGTVDDERLLHLDMPVPFPVSMKVRVILLYPEEDEEWDEEQWIKAGVANPVFEFLKDPAEDIYKPTDGEPFHDEG
ncbi:MAG: hypothetical protein QGH39_06915 [Candidatus Thermoplasmatota archaeon]|jgi:hypothetical protein|nr:hypothetical protein [Candidatus Thermoplasmatota archaeon]MDP7421291.1 hypothetical protein [bacterium]MEE1551464.1 hypothetical protein [Nitrospinaceae bacterium]